jgi:hypothetical protein
MLESGSGTKRTSRPCLRMSVHRGRPEVIGAPTVPLGAATPARPAHRAVPSEREAVGLVSDVPRSSAAPRGPAARQSERWEQRELTKGVGASASSSAAMQNPYPSCSTAPRQNRPGGPVDDRHQIRKAKRHRNIGDVAGPDVIGLGNAHAAQQTGIDLVAGRSLAGAMRGASASIPITRISLCTRLRLA